MDRPGSGDQYHTEPDGGNKEIWNSWAVVGTGGKNEETKGETALRIYNFEAQNPKFEANTNDQSPKDSSKA